ncbi:MAG: ABC transporter substrate-binding protein [Oscillospiraceae bacterium]|nr:ABC transporter substrate-binding protein [Oscillospiraceae bacterium]
MKHLNKALALLLAAVLILGLLAACAKTEKPADASTGTSSTSTEKPEPAKPDESEPTKTDEPEPAEPEEPEEIDPEEIVDLNFYLPDMNNAHGADHQERLNTLVNQITEPKGIHVNLTFLQIGDWVGKVQTSIAGGERIDLMCYCIMNGVTQMYNNKMGRDMTDYLNEYAPETLELMSEYIGADTYNGRIYAVPVLRDYVSNGYLCYNKNMLDEKGLTEQAEAVSSWSELEDLFAAISKAYEGEGIYAHVPSLGSTITTSTYILHGDKFSDIEANDTLGDGAGVVYCDQAEGKVSLFQAMPEYEYSVAMAKRWMDNGYLFPDAIFDSQLSATAIISQGLGVSEFCGSEQGVESNKSSWYGAPALCTKVYDGMISTAKLTGWGMGIPVTCEEPEAAARLINMLYTNADLMNVMIHGEEGVDYEVVDGQAKMIADNAYNMGTYVLGNNMLSLPLYGNGADFYERVAASNKNAPISKFLGFVLDTSDMSLVISQISAVIDQYKTTMQCGGYTEEYLQEYLSKLEAAGVQDYLDEVQAQLDAWLANN